MAAVVNLTFGSFGPSGGACCLVPDGLGNVYVVGSAGDELGANVSVTRLDTASHVVASFRFDGSFDQPRDAALDPVGKPVIAGQLTRIVLYTSTSSDFTRPARSRRRKS